MSLLDPDSAELLWRIISKDLRAGFSESTVNKAIPGLIVTFDCQLTERTIVDDFVKQAMLDHFSLFPTRNHVLEHLFLTLGNGFEWGSDGFGNAVPVACFLDRHANRGILLFEEEMPDMANKTTGLPALDAAYQVNAEFQNLVRSWAAANIDVISSDAFHFYGHSLGKVKPYPYCKGGLLDTAPENIHPEWKRAAVRFAHDILAQIRGSLGLVNSDEETLRYLEQRAQEYLQPFQVCKAAVKRFRDPAQEALAAKLIAEMLTEGGKS
ncbi:hypothetical protein [Cupriavidus taiwanensis]|uniref:hypothetical protein n=1 Tax=Cupriavidus taiwanensis TaxID=164546 RepID=UPI001F009D0B|nr:hypothetical protein [Cupriavidus taiwanensis]